MPINYYIFLSVALFCIGVAGVLTRRNAIIIFMCIELMLNAVNLLLVAFSKMHQHALGAIQIRDRRTAVCVLYHGGRGGGGECGAGDHRHDVSQYAFDRCEFFESVETLGTAPDGVLMARGPREAGI